LKRSRKKSLLNATRQTSDTRAALLSQAKQFGIKGRHRMTKSELVQALKFYRKKKARKSVQTKNVKSSTLSLGRSNRSKYEDLPWSYDKTELVLMPVDPFLLYVYWDFSLKDWNSVQARRKPVVLRVYDVTMIKFNGTNAHHHFDVPIFLKAQNWYVPIWTAEKSFCADLGWLLPDGSLQPIVRSNIITTPRAGASISEESRWVGIRPEGRRITEPSLLKNRYSKKESVQTLWKKVEQQAASLIKGKTAGLSSQRLPPTVQPKTRG
jgi:hypothetical protein